MAAKQQDVEGGPLRTAINSSVRGNATAFGFSITITLSFGAIERIQGQPSLFKLLIFGLAAAAAIGVLEAAVSKGFRRKVGEAGSEVLVLGTALNVVSVAAGVGATVGIGKLLRGPAAWPVAGYVAATTYVLAESLLILIAEGVQRWRGDRSADEQVDAS